MARTLITALALCATAFVIAPAAASAAAADQAVAYQLDPAHDGTTADAITAPLSQIWSITLARHDLLPADRKRHRLRDRAADQRRPRHDALRDPAEQRRHALVAPARRHLQLLWPRLRRGPAVRGQRQRAAERVQRAHRDDELDDRAARPVLVHEPADGERRLRLHRPGRDRRHVLRGRRVDRSAGMDGVRRERRQQLAGRRRQRRLRQLRRRPELRLQPDDRRAALAPLQRHRGRRRRDAGPRRRRALHPRPATGNAILSASGGAYSAATPRRRRLPSAAASSTRSTTARSSRSPARGSAPTEWTFTGDGRPRLRAAARGRRSSSRAPRAASSTHSTPAPERRCGRRTSAAGSRRPTSTTGAC